MTTGLTLLDELSEATISECTFGVFRVPLAEFEAALKTAERS
jgi:hypothetical protein